MIVLSVLVKKDAASLSCGALYEDKAALLAVP